MMQNNNQKKKKGGITYFKEYISIKSNHVLIARNCADDNSKN